MLSPYVGRMAGKDPIWAGDRCADDRRSVLNWPYVNWPSVAIAPVKTIKPVPGYPHGDYTFFDDWPTVH